MVRQVEYKSCPVLTPRRPQLWSHMELKKPRNYTHYPICCVFRNTLLATGSHFTQC